MFGIIFEDAYFWLVLNIGVALLLGMILGNLADKVNLPTITGYLVAGLILGPLTKFIDSEELSHLRIISDIALGFIAFQVGNELWLGKLKKSGTKIIFITVFQAVFTSLVVFLALFFFVDISVALILGAIAAATAPAPIIMIINKKNAKGPLTDTIVPIVGLDDAVGTILFGVLLSLSVTLASPNEQSVHLSALMLEPLKEIGLSIILGAVLGGISGFATKTIDKNNDSSTKRLDVIVVTVFISVGLALLLNASPILTPMIAGAFVTNQINKDDYILEEKTIRFFIPPLMILFFTISGAQLDFSVIATVGIAGLMYVIGRTIGKFIGSFLGCQMFGVKGSVKRNLGIAMLPQSGVAIGLSMAAYNRFSQVDSQMAQNIQNIVLATVLVFALVGPILVQIAFKKAGEIKS